MFTQSCFIRKNTPELRKKLEELGYISHIFIIKIILIIEALFLWDWQMTQQD